MLAWRALRTATPSGEPLPVESCMATNWTSWGSTTRQAHCPVTADVPQACAQDKLQTDLRQACRLSHNIQSESESCRNSTQNEEIPLHPTTARLKIHQQMLHGDISRRQALTMSGLLQVNAENHKTVSKARRKYAQHAQEVAQNQASRSKGKSCFLIDMSSFSSGVKLQDLSHFLSLCTTDARRSLNILQQHNDKSEKKSYEI